MIWVLGFIIGICLGSLTKVIADRSLDNRSFWGRSYCESCKKKLAWYDLFPVLTYLLLRARCRYCHKSLSFEYPMVEFLTGLLTAGVFIKFVPANFFEIGLLGQTFAVSGIIFYCFVLVILISLFLTDFKTGYIPDRITYPAIWTVFLYWIITASAKAYLLYGSLRSSSLGQYLLPPHSNYFYSHLLDLFQPLIYGSLMALSLGLFFYLLIIVTRGKGMGGGDLKLGVFLGLVFGFPYSLMVLMLSFLLGALFGIALILIGKKKFGQTMPFGPFLSLAGVITIFWGAEILSWYLSFGGR